MADISTIPQIVNITHYGGDTLDLKVIAEPGVADGLDWNAQIRSASESDTVDATFTITEPAAPGDPALLRLTGAESSRLAGLTPAVQTRAPNGALMMVQKYSGVWDCQVSAAGLDPIHTLCKGSLTIEIDVTRLP